jgi:uncharacterized membrane protein YeaQ/YmgE (transglycosylase-associated protein family)
LRFFRPSRNNRPKPALDAAIAAAGEDKREDDAKEAHDMGIISWIILGLIAGFIASKIVNHTGNGMFMDIAIGVVGAIVGGIIAGFFGIGGVNGLNIGSIVIAVIGAVVVLWIYNAVVART